LGRWQEEKKGKHRRKRLIAIHPPDSKGCKKQICDVRMLMERSQWKLSFPLCNGKQVKKVLLLALIKRALERFLSFG
jgi:hypothetical protein